MRPDCWNWFVCIGALKTALYYPLDVSAGEDQCRVRHPISVTVFGILRRAVQGEYRAWARNQPRKRDRTFPTFRDKMSPRINQIVRLATGPATGPPSGL